VLPLPAVLVSDFDFHLPPELIAQHPAPERDASRLLVFDRSSASRSFTHFSAILDHLHPGDLLVFNDTRVIPARLRGRKVDGSGGIGGAVEILLLEESEPRTWWTLLRPGKRVRPGTQLHFGPPSSSLPATVLAKNDEGHCQLRFDGDVLDFATLHGELPLPPYIQRPEGPTPEADRERYQTVYARNPGSVAAPTAGLHFTPRILAELQARGVETAHLTLHVGAGTFLPVKTDRIADHRMHEERFSLPPETAAAINRAKAAGRRVIAVGTTTARVLESVARGFREGLWGEIPDADVPTAFHPLRSVEAGRTRIFLHPPCRFRVLDGLLTNFHLPQSTLLMLVSAFAAPGEPDLGRQRMLETYQAAVEARFRFFSYGDAMLLL
jgi:S-adenosylmethionine:tRNA ribosyltransferase-isomerase